VTCYLLALVPRFRDVQIVATGFLGSFRLGSGVGTFAGLVSGSANVRFDSDRFS